MSFYTLFPHLQELLPDLMEAFWQTMIMVGGSFSVCGVIGLPLGVLLVALKEPQLYKRDALYHVISTVIDLFRSTPTLILITAITPFTKVVMGTKIGVRGAIVPLVIASVPFLARQVEAALSKVDSGVIEAAKSMGDNRMTILVRVLLSESFAGIINAFTITFVSLINFSAVAGAVGGGGLGDFALRYGYQQFKTDIMTITVIILLALVTIVQMFGRAIAKKVGH